MGTLRTPQQSGLPDLLGLIRRDGGQLLMCLLRNRIRISERSGELLLAILGSGKGKGKGQWPQRVGVNSKGKA